MPVGKLRLGQLVSSRAGRDLGQKYLVIGKSGDRFILLANGETRKVSNPKKKNVRHLVFHQVVAQDIEAKLAAGEPVFDEEVRAALAETESEE